MFNSRNLILLFAGALLGAPATSADPAGVFPYEVERHVLPNGLKLILIPMPSEGLVSYWSVVRTGSRDEVEPGVTGFAHFFEHMMFRGSEKFPGPVYDGIVSEMGADANAYTTDDYTAYHLSFTKEDLPKVIEIEADRFQNLSYSEPEFKTEAGAVYGEYRKSRTSPFSVMFESVQNAAFDVHTYKHTTIGFEEDIEAMPTKFDYSKSFFKRFYRPENVVVLAVGDIDSPATLKLIQKHYGSWEKGYQPPEVKPEPEQTAQRRVDVPFDGQTLPMVALTFKGERFLPEDRTMMAGTLLGELAFGQTSAIYKKLVLDEQRLQSLFENFDFNRDPGLWLVLGLVKEPSDLPAIEGELWDAVAALRRQPVDQKLLDDARSRVKYSFLSRLSTPGDVAQNLAQIVALTGDVNAVDQMFSTLDRVTPEDVQQAARRWLRTERSTVAVVHAKDEPITTASVGFDAPVLLPVEQDPNVTIKIWFRAGSQDDPPGKEGLAALTAALLDDGGTMRRSYDEILAAVFPLAARYGASVDKEMTVFSGSVHRDKIDEFYAIFSEVLLQPGFREEDFERLKASSIAGIEKVLRYSSDEELGKAALTEAVFRGTPYQHLIDGSIESLRAITLDDVREFYAQRYTRDNLLLGLGGAYPDELPGRLAADLARLPAGAAEMTAAPEPKPIRGRQVTLVEKPGPSAAISLGYPIDLHRGSREFYALWIANSWLGEHRNSSSHLYQVIREARGMNYGDYSYIEAFPGGGRRSMPPTGVGRRQQMFEVWIRPVPRERTLFALRAALREVELLSKNGLTQEQFDATRRFLGKYSLHFAETVSERLGYALDDRFYEIEGSHLAKFRKMMGEITLEEVNAAVKKHIRADNLRIAIVAAEAEAMKRDLVAGKPSPIDYGEIPKPAEVLAEDKLIESFPLGITEQAVTIVPVDRMFEKVPARTR